VQRKGVQFLYNLYFQGKGGILADDMGLGKTVIAIAFVAAILGKQGTREDALRPRGGSYTKQVNPKPIQNRAVLRLHGSTISAL